MKQYSFLSKIQSQVDLQDIWGILKEPILVLENLEEQLLKQQVQKKTQLDNLEIQFKVEQLIHKDFPSLIDSYCDLSLDYRNTHILKKEKNGSETLSLTAKNIFTKNISILIDQIYQLEQEFNETNQKKLLVRDKINSNLQTEKDPVYHLENEFNYQNYQKSSTQSLEQFVNTHLPKVNEQENKTSKNFKEKINYIFHKFFYYSSFAALFIIMVLFLIFILK
jgi:hypothetical protein